ncbi:hypothetical protein [uncultured Marinobacter sp.]|uniref:hypothetical protein n=1 Tax=uncultured Marinobacter sp. TaxID=187379 RepID=UPI0030D8B0C3
MTHAQKVATLIQAPRANAARLLTRWLTITLFAVVPVSSTAESSKRVLQIAVIDDVPSTRLATQLLVTAYATLGLRLDTTIVPSRRALLMADQGLVDGDLFRIEEVASQYPDLVQVPYPLLQGRLMAVVADPLADSLPAVNDRPLRVAVRRGVIIAEMTADRLGMKTILADNYQQMRALLDWGRVDLMLISDIEELSPLANSDWQDLGILPQPVTTFVLYHYLHKRHSDLAHDLAETLREMNENGVTLRITNQARLEHTTADR